MTQRVYVLAQDRKEARELFELGFGYVTKKQAKDARNAPEIDSYYRNLLKVYEFAAAPRTDGGSK